MQLTARRLFSFDRASWRETAVLMVVAWLVPFLIHLLPWAGPRPLGAHLLPAFWTAFVAVYLYGFSIGAFVALVVPVTNLLTTGLPVSNRTALMTVELIAFVGFAALLLRRWPGLRSVAVLAWLPARAVAVATEWALPIFQSARNPVDQFTGSLVNGVWGLAVLLAVNVALVHLLPKDQDWDAE
jgi:hypothetical protein